MRCGLSPRQSIMRWAGVAVGDPQRCRGQQPAANALGGLLRAVVRTWGLMIQQVVHSFCFTKDDGIPHALSGVPRAHAPRPTTTTTTLHRSPLSTGGSWTSGPGGARSPCMPPRSTPPSSLSASPTAGPRSHISKPARCALQPARGSGSPCRQGTPGRGLGLERGFFAMETRLPLEGWCFFGFVFVFLF